MWHGVYVVCAVCMVCVGGCDMHDVRVVCHVCAVWREGVQNLIYYVVHIISPMPGIPSYKGFS